MAEKRRGAAKVVPIKGQTCARCARLVVAQHRPFCSRRCADLDLGAWLGGEYRIATNEGSDDGGESPEED